MMEKKLETRNKIAVFYGGNQISPYEFDDVREMNGYVIAFTDTFFKIFNNEGECIISENAKCVHFYNNCIAFCKNNLCGVYSYDGRLIIPIEFTSVVLCDEDKGIMVEKDKLWGLYSYDGSLILPIQFTSIDPYKRDIIVKKDDLYGVYSHDGNPILPVQFTSIDLYATAIMVEKDKLYGAYSYDGTPIVPLQFTNIYFSHIGIEVKKDGLSGLYSYDGSIILPVKFFDYSIFKTGAFEVQKEKNGPWEDYIPEKE